MKFEEPPVPHTDTVDLQPPLSTDLEEGGSGQWAEMKCEKGVVKKKMGQEAYIIQEKSGKMASPRGKK
ncbi:unnamed protein product [Linum trigynum]|uniref:Uncharacterized protein n=1 Tax=Linum trigynum TaxID=586398 RepID=A0AAV2DU08_9ROSI